MGTKCAFDMSELLDDLRLSTLPLKKRRGMNGATWDLADKLHLLHLDPTTRPLRSHYGSSGDATSTLELDSTGLGSATEEEQECAGDVFCDADDEGDRSGAERHVVHAFHPDVQKLCQAAMASSQRRFPLFREPKADQYALVPYVPPEQVMERILTGKKWTAPGETDPGYESETESDALRVLRKTIQELLGQVRPAAPVEGQMEVDVAG